MVRTLPSVIPPKMYRHFALVTVLLTAGLAMFASGESREAASTLEEQHAAQSATPNPGPTSAAPEAGRKDARRRPRFAHGADAFDGFDGTFGAPMERALGSAGSYSRKAAAAVSQAGYSENYLASLDTEDRELLLKGLQAEGVLAPEERERKSAALIAASQVRGGVTVNN